MNKGKVFIISGPSGCGKSTVLREVFSRRENYYFSISATTRSIRPGECDGVDYLFINKCEFLKMLSEDAFLEHAEYAGNYYGTPRAQVDEKTSAGTDVILDIEVQGAAQIKSKMPEAISIFIAPPSLEELENRLRGRSTESEEKIKMRLETAKVELALADTYDYIVVNDIVEKAAEEILNIMIKTSKSERN